ncbi:HXXEE domain-containing protein [Chromobacterium sp. IIBBL 290-4]|uniref:HXXEE domain-containing protein n=1 Tax=Chromobacterium sp. IIBBL 290-4 TaxID=2953890 RepID=UPI0020B7746E|nr:HXXEE domain-containing protein [Chromobacterium sp. IIBBL 290-4]UTH74313.1 HXXEE domain-containing protein [Chromobacterium sp. IIBBL 290-4]
MTLTHWAWLFTLAALLHNLEEALWLPAWSRRQRRYPQLDARAFAIASGLVSLFFIASSLGLALQMGLALAMAVNALAHCAVTLLQRAYMPGAASGLLLIFPFAGGLLAKGWRDGALQSAWPTALIIAAASLALIPFLLRAGEIAGKCLFRISNE